MRSSNSNASKTFASHLAGALAKRANALRPHGSTAKTVVQDSSSANALKLYTSLTRLNLASSSEIAFSGDMPFGRSASTNI